MDWKHFIIQMICILHWLLGEKTAMCLSAKCQDGGEGRVRCVERVTLKLTLPNITDSQREFAVWLRKLTQGLRVNPDGWVGEEDGSKFQKGGDICISVSDSC